MDLKPEVVRLLAPLLNNLYWVHLDIIDVCAKWVPRREQGDERMWLATQLKREVSEVPMYQGLLQRLGITPDPKMRIRDSLTRYQQLKETEDEIDMVVGMNGVAQGTLGIIEHEQLYRFAPDLLAPFAEAAIGMYSDLQHAVMWMRRRERESVAAAFHRYWAHLHEVSLPEIGPLIRPLVAAGVFTEDLIRESEQRFRRIMTDTGLDPTSLQSYAV